jgi:hypothetical protein
VFKRQKLIDWEQKETPVTIHALNRSSLYYQLQPPSEEEVALKHRIDDFLRSALFTVIARSPNNCTAKSERSIEELWQDICKRWD